jgi:VanZ family protein
MRWLAVILWMIVMFSLSTEAFSAGNAASISPALGKLIVRKLAHFSEYLILASLIMRALTAEEAGTGTLRRVLIAVVVAVAYAMTDEWHQSFVRSRNSQISDVAIDAIGAVCGSWAWALYRRISR